MTDAGTSNLPVVSLAEEMGRDDPEAFRPTADVGVVASGDGHAQAAGDLGDAEGFRRRLGRHFGGVFIFDGHAPRTGGATDNPRGALEWL
ncbi:hypothetical protein GCM10027187_60240 [Streptosporangium sandarakinum]